VFIGINRADIPAAARTMRDTNGWWIAAATGGTLLALSLQGVVYWLSLRAFGANWPLRAFLLIGPAARFLNMVMKGSNGMAGLPLMLAESRRRRTPLPQSTAAYVISAELMQLAFIVPLASALLISGVSGHVTPVEWTAAGIFGLYAAVALLALVLAATSERAMAMVQRAIRTISSIVLRRPSHESGGLGLSLVMELHRALDLARRRPMAFPPAAGAALLLHLAGVATLWATLEALGVHATFGTALFAYCMGTLFAIVGFLPAGLGFAEAGLALALASSGVPGSQAAAAVVVFRVFDAWLPLGAGAAAFSRLSAGYR